MITGNEIKHEPSSELLNNSTLSLDELLILAEQSDNKLALRIYNAMQCDYESEASLTVDELYGCVRDLSESLSILVTRSVDGAKGSKLRKEIIDNAASICRQYAKHDNMHVRSGVMNLKFQMKHLTSVYGIKIED